MFLLSLFQDVKGVPRRAIDRDPRAVSAQNALSEITPTSYSIGNSTVDAP